MDVKLMRSFITGVILSLSLQVKGVVYCPCSPAGAIVRMRQQETERREREEREREQRKQRKKKEEEEKKKNKKTAQHLSKNTMEQMYVYLLDKERLSETGTALRKFLHHLEYDARGNC